MIYLITHKTFIHSIHCNADWTPSELMQSEYLEGFYEEPIVDYQFFI